MLQLVKTHNKNYGIGMVDMARVQVNTLSATDG
jgi:hypothetical protein